jgi:hypothetical protein
MSCWISGERPNARAWSGGGSPPPASPRSQTPKRRATERRRLAAVSAAACFNAAAACEMFVFLRPCRLPLPVLPRSWRKFSRIAAALEIMARPTAAGRRRSMVRHRGDCDCGISGEERMARTTMRPPPGAAVTSASKDFVFNVSNSRPPVVILQPSRERFGVRCNPLLDGVSSLDFGPASRGAFFMACSHFCAPIFLPPDPEAQQKG